MRKPPRLRLLGGEVDVYTLDQLLGFVAALVRERRRALIANHNLHSLHLFPREPEMQDLYGRADLIQIDSMPLVWWGRLMGHAVSADNRFTYTGYRDALWPVIHRNGWRVFHLGGRPGVGARAAEKLRAAWPGVVIGERHGYFDMTPGGPEAEAILADIEAFRPDIVLVGMGMPRQERWLAQNWDRLPPAVYWPIGAAFDYDAGVVAACPTWVARAGFEWLFRFVQEPRRLFARYFVEPISLVPEAAADLRERLGRSEPRQQRLGHSGRALPVRKG
jgi:N-acetylglucosaminyldiphosphoundecaprenol N-acetyl-beta-D-mannosaminyltransferase